MGDHVNRCTTQRVCKGHSLRSSCLTCLVNIFGCGCQHRRIAGAYNRKVWKRRQLSRRKAAGCLRPSHHCLQLLLLAQLFHWLARRPPRLFYIRSIGIPPLKGLLPSKVSCDQRLLGTSRTNFACVKLFASWQSLFRKNLNVGFKGLE